MTVLCYAFYMSYFSKLSSQLRGAVLLAGALAASSIQASAETRDWQDTCRFFSNAAFKDRHVWGETTFRMELAQDCVDAMVYAQSANPVVRDRAETYLSQLQAYREVMVAILVDRARTRPGERNDDWGYQKWRPAVYPISRTGAYLIARDMGVVETHQDWTTWRRQASLPLFRLDEVQTN